GSAAWRRRCVSRRVNLDLPLQINSTVSRLTLPYIDAIAERISDFPVTLWALFFLIQTGRGASLEQISAEECERTLNHLYDLSLHSPFGIKTTEAPQYHRVVLQREHEDNGDAKMLTLQRRRQLRAPRSVNDGNGFAFVDHIGNICPSGFLPEARGNARTHDIADVYRTDAMFLCLRDADALLGKCGRCQFRSICGGSRSRAYAATGNVMASDSLCVFEPGPEVPSPVPL